MLKTKVIDLEKKTMGVQNIDSQRTIQSLRAENIQLSTEIDRLKTMLSKA